MSPEGKATKTCGRSNDGRATFAESNTNFTEAIFQMIASELIASSWRILSKRISTRMNPRSNNKLLFHLQKVFKVWKFLMWGAAPELEQLSVCWVKTESRRLHICLFLLWVVPERPSG